MEQSKKRNRIGYRRSHLYIWFLLAIAALPSMNVFSQQINEGWKVLRSSSAELILEFCPTYVPSDTIRLERQTYTQIDFVGSIPNSYEREGYPDVRYANCCIALPSRTVNASVIAATYDEVNGIAIPPVQVFDYRINQSVSGSERSLPAIDGAAYVSAEYQPDTLARVVRIREVQQVLVATVEVYPVQFNAAARQVRKYNRIVVRIQFGTPAVQTVTAASPAPVLSMVLNKSAARYWRTRKPVLAKTPTPGVRASGEWYKIEIKSTGLYRLDYATLKNAGVNVDQIDPRTIKIYNNGGKQLPEPMTTTRPEDLVENAILVDGEEDGKFDNSDAVLFYGRSPRGWIYDPAQKAFFHYINEYTESNFYWLTINGIQGKRMAVVPEAVSDNPYRPSSTIGKIFFEEETNKIIVSNEDGSGRQWFGPKLSSQSASLTRRETLSDAIPDSPVRVRAKAIARSDERTILRISQDNTVLGAIAFSSIYNNSEADDPSPVNLTGKAPAVSSQSMFQFQYITQSVGSETYIDWYEILYSREFRAINDELPFDAPDTNTVVFYSIDGFSSTDVRVMDVSDYANVKILQKHAATLSGFEFKAVSVSGAPPSYFAVAPAAFKSPVGIQKAGTSDLHGADPDAELLIITHKDFWAAASRLAAYRNLPGHNILKTIVVDVSDIYDEFASGQPDVVAIRDYIRHAYTRWTRPPKYVLLFGDGTYDYKNIMGQGLPWIPPYETEESLHYIYSYPYDDFYVMLDSSSSIPTLPIGRITCRSEDEANVWVDKIINYETSTDFDDWRNQILFCADDGLISGTQTVSQLEHTNSTESLSLFYTPKRYDQKKIYLVEYPTVLGSSGRTKPDAAKDLIDQWNLGALIINWMGHGNPQYWAHEHVFDRGKTLQQLNNGNRLPIVVASTCDFARFDALEQSGAEDLASREEGGAIVTLATSRAVYGSYNAVFNNALYSALLEQTDSLGQVGRLGDAWIQAKQKPPDVTNNQKFHIIGDPSILPQSPRALVAIDSINDAAATGSITIPALKKTTIRGHLLPPIDTAGSNPMQVAIVVRDGDRRLSIIDELNATFSFTKTGEILFRGIISTTGGKFSGTFIPPKDISYSDRNGRITLYATDGTTDAVGYTSSIKITGVDSTVGTDTQGPEISLFLQSRNFHSGDLVRENPTLYVDLFDENGINLSTASIGHGLDFWLDDATKSTSLSEYYRSAQDSYQQGTIEYPLQSIAPGDHTLKVRAWDTYNNSTTTETKFRVAASDVFTVTEVMNYPNPFSTNTTFTFNQNQIDGIDVEIKIYTVAGRLIRTVREPAVTGSFVQIPWDGTDEDGDPIANGVYLYKVILKTTGGEKTLEVLGKLAVLK